MVEVSSLAAGKQKARKLKLLAAASAVDPTENSFTASGRKLSTASRSSVGRQSITSGEAFGAQKLENGSGLLGYDLSSEAAELAQALSEACGKEGLLFKNHVPHPPRTHMWL